MYGKSRDILYTAPPKRDADEDEQTDD